MSRALLMLVVAVTGCGSAPSPADAGPERDTGPDAAPDAAVVAPIAPDPTLPAQMPILTPCLPGWRAVIAPDDPATVICDPWPEGGPSICADDEVQLPGSAACERIGPPCPDGDFADDLPEDRAIVHVRPGAEGGDGSSEQPWGTIAEAVAAAPEGAVIALSRGTFDEVVEVEREVTLWGACVQQTLISATAAGAGDSAVTLRGRARGLRNLTLTGAGLGLAIDRAELPVELAAVVVRDVAGVGIGVDAGVPLVARGLAVRRVRPRRERSVGLLGINVAVVTLDGVALEDAGHYGISFTESSRLEASHLVVRGTTSPEGPDDGGGLFVSRSVVSLAGAVFERCADASIAVVDAGGAKSIVDATDLIVQDSVSDPTSGEPGRALIALGDPVLRLTRARVERSTGVALSLIPAEAILTDVLVRDTLPQAGPDLVSRGNGILIEQGTVELIRVAVLGSHQAAIRQSGDSLVAASDLVVRGTRAVAVGEAQVGQGLVLEGGRTDVLRATIEDSDVCGVLVTGEETILSAADLAIRAGGSSAPEGAYGQGLCATDGAHVSLRLAHLEQNRTAALDLRGAGTELTGTDVALVATAPQPSSGRWGAGAIVLDGARLDVERIRVADNAWVGVLAQGEGSVVELLQVLVEGTRADELGDGGMGLSAAEGGELAVERFEIAEGARCGVHVGAGASVSLLGGQLRANPTAACVATDGAMHGGAEEGVVLVDNQSDLGDAGGFEADARAMPEVIGP